MQGCYRRGNSGVHNASTQPDAKEPAPDRHRRGRDGGGACSRPIGVCPLHAVRDRRWKYVRTFDLKDRDKLVYEELYDLQVDPHETTNLAGRPGHAERQKAMAQAMRSLRLEAEGVPDQP